MPKVKITNICKDKCVGFSFKMLKPGQSTVIDEERVTEADLRLIKGGKLAEMKDFTAEKIAPKKNVKPEPEAPKEKKKDEGEIISPKSEDKKDSTPDIITPENIEGLAIEEEPKEEVKKEVGEVKVEAPKEEVSEELKEAVKVYTRDELQSLGRGELRKIGTPLGVSGRAVDKLVSDILKAQGNE